MRERLLRAYARWVYRHAKSILVGAILLTALSLTYSIFYLKTQTGLLDLYSKDNPVSQRFLNYVEKFGAAENLIVVFEGGSENERHAAMDALATNLKDDPRGLIDNLFYKVDLELFKRHSLQFLKEKQAEAMLQEVDKPDGGIRALMTAKDFGEFLDYLNRSVEKGLATGKTSEANPAQSLQKLIEPLLLFRDFLDGQTLSEPVILSRMGTGEQEQKTLDDAGYLRTDDKKMHVMFIRPSDRKQDYKVDEELVKRARREIAQISPNYPTVTIGVTGGPALNSDQFKISEKDMTLASIFAFTSTGVLFILAFKAFIRPFLGLLTLALSMTWVFGFTTLAFGHLNIFSLAFLVILVGQGTYYGVHVVARYEEELQKGLGIQEAIENTLVHIFGNITTATLTTAAAFFATTMVDLKGFAELGWIAGVGVILSSAAMQIVLPALLVLVERNKVFKTSKPVASGAEKPWIRFLRVQLESKAWFFALLMLAFAGTGAYLFYSPKHGIEFDNNLLNLQARDTEAVRYEKKLIETSLSPRAGIFVTTSKEEAAQIAKLSEALPTVQRVEWMGGILPTGDSSQKTTQALRQGIASLKVSNLGAPDLEKLQSELTRFEKNFDAIDNLAINANEGEKLLALTENGRQAIAEIRKKFPKEDLDEQTKATLNQEFLLPQVVAFQKLFFDALRSPLVSSAKAKTLVPQDLPRGIVEPLLSSDQSYAIYAFPKVNIWERAPLESFIGELRSVRPDVTGPPVMFYEMLQLVRESYFKAAMYSALAIFGLFLLDFRSLRYAVMASMPLLLGILSLFGLMSVFKIPFNTANMIALPMILGIGASNGVHMIHRFREEKESNIDFLFKSTGKALIITYFDSVTSFIGLAFANHQGLSQLGKVAILGLTCCTLAGFFFLPALMQFVIRRHRSA